MFLSCLLIDTGENPDRPRPGRLWLRNAYRIHQRLCMGFPSAHRLKADGEFLHPFTPEDFGLGHVHAARAMHAGFLFRVDALGRGRAAVLVQSAHEPNWDYAFQNARHLLAAPPAVRVWDPQVGVGQRFRFRLRANAVRRIAPREPGRDGPRVPVPPTDEHMKAWMERRAVHAGFSVDEFETIVPGYVYMNKSLERSAGVRLRSVLYTGTLTISDLGAFRQILARGIGPGKAFGFGLLSIAPA